MPLGICNGFQILVESGLLPGFSGITEIPEAALTTNIPKLLKGIEKIAKTINLLAYRSE